MVVVGGVTSPAGAVLGALYLQGVRWFLPTDWQFLATGVRRAARAADPARRARRPRCTGSATGGCRGSHAATTIEAPGPATPPRAADRRRMRRAAADAARRGAVVNPSAAPLRSRGGAAVFRSLVLFGLNAVDELDRTAFARPPARDPRRVRPRPPGRARRSSPSSTLGALLLQVPIASLADRHNRVRIAWIGAAVWGVFSLLTGLATTLVLLAIARSGSGIGRAVVDPTHNSLIADYYDVGDRPRVYSFHRAANAVGAFVGPLAAGLLASAFGWRVPVPRLRRSRRSSSWSSPSGCTSRSAGRTRAPGRWARPRRRHQHRGAGAVVRRGVADRVEDRDAAADLVLAAVPRRVAHRLRVTRLRCSTSRCSTSTSGPAASWPRRSSRRSSSG